MSHESCVLLPGGWVCGGNIYPLPHLLSSSIGPAPTVPAWPLKMTASLKSEMSS